MDRSPTLATVLCRHLRWTAAFWLALVAIASLTGASEPVAAGPEAASLEQWIAELEADDFARREAATRRLSMANASVVPLLEAAIAEKGLETVTRGTHVLEKLARMDNPEMQSAATDALRRLSQVQQPVVTKYASKALASVAEFRREQAIAHLSRMGAQFVPIQGLGPEPGLFPMRAVQLDANWRGSLDDLQQLAWLTDFTVVCLEGNRFDDDALGELARIEHLEGIKVKRGAITAEGLRSLRTLPNLRQLALMYMPLTDDAAQVLQELQTLESVVLFGTKISTDAVARLGQMHPVLRPERIHHRNGAFLGISFLQTSDGLGCPVQNVTESSAAHRAGILPNDRIIGMDGKPIRTSQDLTDAIGKFEPGQEVEVRVLRLQDTQTELTLKVKFGEWP